MKRRKKTRKKKSEVHFQHLADLMSRLRGTDGCPWDREQTLESLKKYLIEETYEVAEAIEDEDAEKLKEELGDLLFEIVFVSQICSEKGLFNIRNVIGTVYNKMVQRHPHIFGNAKADSPQEVLNQWHQIKSSQRKSVLDNIPRSLPALSKAQKIQRNVAGVGFDWEKINDVLAKIEEELGETKRALKSNRRDKVGDEIGDLLFSIVNLARFLKLDAESLLVKANKRFMRRFREIESKLTADGRKLTDFSLKQMDMEWELAKRKK